MVSYSKIQILQSIGIWDIEACVPPVPSPDLDCIYTEWEYVDCSVTCGKGFQIGTRQVLQGSNCEGQLSAFRSCELETCTAGMKCIKKSVKSLFHSIKSVSLYAHFQNSKKQWTVDMENGYGIPVPSHVVKAFRLGTEILCSWQRMEGRSVMSLL